MTPNASNSSPSREQSVVSQLEGAVSALDDFEFEDVEDDDTRGGNELEDGCLSCS